MALIKRARLWVDDESVSTVAKLYFAEAVRCSAIVDKNVVRLNVCGLIRDAVTPHLSDLHNTCVNITTAMKRL